jgi:hypothetical protein
MLKQFLVPDDQFFATAMRSPQGRKRLEKAVRRARTQSIFGVVLFIFHLYFQSSRLALNIFLQIRYPEGKFSDSTESILFFFGLAIAILTVCAIRWYSLTNELKMIAAWPFSPTGQTDDLANTTTAAAGEEVKP